MRGLLLLMLMMLAGCGQEEDFDTRFERTKADLELRSEILERDLAARRAAEEGVAPEQPAATPTDAARTAAAPPASAE